MAKLIDCELVTIHESKMNTMSVQLKLTALQGGKLPGKDF